MTTTTTTTNRPSIAIYMRQDKSQLWKSIGDAYEMGYVAALADLGAGLKPLTLREHSDLLIDAIDYFEGYSDAIADNS